MSIRLRNLLTLPVLFFGFGGETSKSKAEEPSIPIVKKQETVKPAEPFNNKIKIFNLDPERTDFWIQEEIKADDFMLPAFKKYYFDRKPVKDEQTNPKRPISKDDISVVKDLNNNDSIFTLFGYFLPVSITLFIVSGGALALAYKTKPFKKNQASNIETFLNSFNKNNSPVSTTEPSRYITSDNLFPEESARLMLLLKLIENKPGLYSLCLEPCTRIYFDKGNISEFLKERNHPLYLQYLDANYPVGRQREDVKLESFTLVEENFNGEGTVDYVIVIENYNDPAKLLVSVLRELHRISEYQEYNNQTPSLYSLQMGSMIGVINSLDRMLTISSRHSGQGNKAIDELIEKEIEQLELWQSVGCQYNVKALPHKNYELKDS